MVTKLDAAPGVWFSAMIGYQTTAAGPTLGSSIWRCSGVCAILELLGRAHGIAAMGVLQAAAAPVMGRRAAPMAQLTIRTVSAMVAAARRAMAGAMPAWPPG